MKYLLLTPLIYVLYRFLVFTLEPDYIPGFVARNEAIRCNCGAYWIDELEERLRNR